MPIISVVWVISYYWWMVSYLLANSIQLQQALKVVHPNIPRNCWSPVGVELWQATFPWNRDKRPDKMATNHILYLRWVTVNANRGRAYSSEYKKPPHIWHSDQGCTNCPLRRPHCCSKNLKPFSLTHCICLYVHLFPVLFFVILLSPFFFSQLHQVSPNRFYSLYRY